MMGYSRLDYLKAQALAARMAAQQDPMMGQYPGLNMQNMMMPKKPSYQSNTQGLGQQGLYKNAIRGYSGGVGY